MLIKLQILLILLFSLLISIGCGSTTMETGGAPKAGVKSATSEATSVTPYYFVSLHSSLAPPLNTGRLDIYNKLILKRRLYFKVL